MIIDQIENAYLYYGMSRELTTALRYLQNIDPLNVKLGKYEIDGSNIYALIQQYETKPRENGLWEAHRRYIDVHYITKGVELIGYASLTHLKAGEYDDVKDFSHLQGDGNFFVVRAGTFVIFAPQDAHMPSLSVSTTQIIQKIVLKVPL